MARKVKTRLEADEQRGPELSAIEQLFGAAGLDYAALQAQINQGDDPEAGIERERQRRIVHEALNTAAGRKFYLWLVAKINRPPSDEERMSRDPQALAIVAAQRVGERQILLMIEEALEMQPLKAKETTDAD